MTTVRARFSIVTAVYNVEPYLPEFIASIEAQRFDPGRIEVIAVDDGSTDGSLAMLEAWAARRPELVTVLKQPKGGRDSARNLGLAHATGEWVTFADPDEHLDRALLADAARFADLHPNVEVIVPDSGNGAPPAPVATGPAVPHEGHRHGDTPVAIGGDSGWFPVITSAVLYRVGRVRALGLQFEAGAVSDDHDFAVRFMHGIHHPVVGILRRAGSTRRADVTRGGSLLPAPSDAGAREWPTGFGLLDALARVGADDHPVPHWVQAVIISEVARYLEADEAVSNPARIPAELLPVFHDILDRAIVRLKPSVIRAHTGRRLKTVWADILGHGGRPRPWHSPVAIRTKVDARTGMQRVHYRYLGARPHEEIRVDGSVVVPAYGKTMIHVYYGRSMMLERIVWLPVGHVEVRLDGKPLGVATGQATHRARVGPPTRRARIAALRVTSPGTLLRGVDRRLTRLARQGAAIPYRVIARMPPYRSAFRDAWVLMDRIFDAGDNGERLFTYLRAERPDINAWFVVEKGTPDWIRLHASSGSRVVAHGSFRWRMLMLNCSWLLSSHGSKAIAEPGKVSRLIDTPSWRYGFLQHGVVQSDLSRWLNRRDMDFMVSTTQAELEAYTADGTPYLYTGKEVRRTGQPRHDRLLAKAREVAPGDADLVIVAPTWRMWMTSDADTTTHRRAVSDAVWDSDYLRNWLAILGSAAIEKPPPGGAGGSRSCPTRTSRRCCPRSVCRPTSRR